MRRRLAVALALLAVVGLVGVAAADPIFPNARSPVQSELWELFTIVGWMAVAVSVFVIGLLVYVIYKFKGDPLVKKRGEWFTHNARLEITWTVATAIVLIFLGVVTAQAMDRVEKPPISHDAASEAIDVVAIGLQWQWQFAYPDGNVTTNDLHVAAGRNVRLSVISCDVIHSLYIPELGVKIDTAVVPSHACEAARKTGEVPPGSHPARFWFRANQPGRYDIRCAEYCGAGHAFMTGDVVAFEPGSRREPYGPPLELGRVIHVEYSGSGDDLQVSPSTIQATAGDLVTFVVHNNATSNHDFTLGAPYNVSTPVIQPGSSRRLVRVTLDRAGTIPYFSSVGDDRAQGLNGTIDVRAGEVVPVELYNDGTWDVNLARSGFEPGQTVAFKVYNNGTTSHNLHIGAFSQQVEGRYKTKTFSPGEGPVWLNVTLPEEGATFTAWCDVPGHYEAGMHSPLTVGEGDGGGGDQGPGRDLLLPGPEALGALAGLAVAAWIVKRRD